MTKLLCALVIVAAFAVPVPASAHYCNGHYVADLKDCNPPRTNWVCRKPCQSCNEVCTYE
jgi:hypothetical protein